MHFVATCTRCDGPEDTEEISDGLCRPCVRKDRESRAAAVEAERARAVEETIAAVRRESGHRNVGVR